MSEILESGDASRRTGWAPRFQVATFARLLATLFVAFALVPEWGLPMSTGIDAGYLWAIDRLVAEGAAPGRAWLFPFGPLAPWLRPMASGAALDVARLFLLGLWAATTVLWARLGARTPLWQYALASLLLVAADLSFEPVPEYRIALLVLFLVTPTAMGGAATTPFIVAGGLLAVAGFVKLSAALLVLLILFGLLATGGHRLGRGWLARAVIGLLAGVVTVALPVAVGFFGSVGDLLVWARSQVEFAAGYSAAMSLGESGAAAWLAAATLGLTLWAGLALLHRGSELGALLVALVPALFAAGKHGFVRALVHPWAFIGLALGIVALSALWARRRIDWLAAGAMTLLVATTATAVVARDGVGPWQGLLRGANPVNGVERLWEFRSLERRRQQLVRASQELLQPARLDEGMVSSWQRSGYRVALAPWDLSPAAANDLAYAPLGVLQLYSAYTGWLDRHAAETFDSGSSPERLLVHGESIDRRGLFWEAPRTWSAIARRYRPSGEPTGNARWLALERRGTPLRLDEIARSVYALPPRGVWIDLPPDLRSDEELRIDIRLEPTVVGKLRDALYRTEPLFLEIQRVGGARTQRYRLVPRHLTDLRVDVVPRNVRDLGALLARAQVARVSRVRRVGAGWTSFASTGQLVVRRLRVATD